MIFSLSKIKSLKSVEKKSTGDYYNLNRYDIFIVGGFERLITKVKEHDESNVEMNFSSPDDIFTHSETQTKLRSILQITIYISLNLLTNKYRNNLKPLVIYKV
jgi:hypothetical protein